MASQARQLADKSIAPPGRRNLIINGAMQVAQRGTSDSGVSGSTYYTLDRYKTSISSMGTFTQSQSTDVPSGQGFASSLKMDCTTADASPAAGDYIQLAQRIEGQNVQHLKKGTSNAVSLTVSFWVKSSKTGTYIAELQDLDNSRMINKSYTIDTADTWEKKTITYAGDTTGTLDNNNGESFRLTFFLGAGSNYTSGTLQTSWGSRVEANRAVGQVNLADDTSNEWYITGVQLEVGSVATEFEHRSFGEELALCQRYYHRQERTDTTDATGAIQRNVAGLYLGIAQITSTTTGFLPVYMPTTMRATPSISYTDVSDISVNDGTALALSTFSLVAHKMHNIVFINLGFASGGTANDAARVYINTLGSFVDFDAEL